MTASPGDGEHAAREGYYPDPSIPGYVRYWNGAAWVPGTSRPAPAPAPAAPVEETGPVFLDRTSVTGEPAEPEPEPEPEAGPEPVLRAVVEPLAERGAERPAERGAEQAVWQADPLRQAGFGGPRDHRVSWGSPAEPPAAPGPGISLARTPSAAAAAAPAPRFPAQAAAGILSARSPAAAAPAPAPTPAPAPAPEPVPGPAWPDAPGGSGSGGSGLTSSWPEAEEAPARPSTRRAAPAAPAEPAPREAPVRRSPIPAPAPSWPGPGDPAEAPPAEASRFEPWQPRTGGARPTLPARGTAAPAEPRPESRSEPRESRPEPRSESRPEPRSEGTRTPRAVFEQMADRAVRPAGLVRRAVARALDTLVLAAVAAAAARPLLPAATAHIQDKVDAARTTGRTTTVWLLDGTIAGQLGLVFGAVLLFGVFYEALPTARWGRTPGKKLLGVRVLAAATLRPPTFGAALRRWLVFVLLGLPGSLWCLVDRPRRRAWHDRAAGTYVAR
ncbi:RDD family protein [Streptomyces sp. NPDC006463]|uniref:RDD family protein n=1 Tax=Streptomyces sp. NPDC006463 TaxID=3364746 RepID=UPI0036B3D9CE